MRATADARFPRFGGFRRFWAGAAFVGSAVAILPVALLFGSWIFPQSETWNHLADTLLTGLIVRSLVLALGVGVVAGVLGTSLAALTTFVSWPGRQFFAWALVLPLALPVYVNAFVWARLLDYSGALQIFLRSHDLSPPPWLQVRSLGGAILVLGASLYPYVYLLARQAFLSQGTRGLEAARSLGRSPGRAFWDTVLPMARPWISAGILLCIMEALSDFGAVSILAVDTLSVGVYRTWQGLFAPLAAAQLSTLIVLVILALNAWNRRLQGNRSFASRGVEAPEPRPFPLSRSARHFCLSLVGSLWILLFALPCAVLISWALGPQMASIAPQATWQAFFNSLGVGALSACAACALAFLLCTARRLIPSPLLRQLTQMSLLGYSLPGSVLAISVFLPFAWTDRVLNEWGENWLGWTPGLLLTSSLLALVFGQTLRFLALPMMSLESALKRLPQRIDEMALSLGLNPSQVLSRVHVPLLRRGLCVGALLVLVDVIKEIPMTLMMRPRGWDTLSVRVYQLSAEGLWNEAARPALLLVLVGLLPTLLLIHSLRAKTQGGGAY